MINIEPSNFFTNLLIISHEAKVEPIIFLFWESSILLISLVFCELISV